MFRMCLEMYTQKTKKDSWHPHMITDVASMAEKIIKIEQYKT